MAAAVASNAVSGPISTKFVSRQSLPGRRRVTSQAAWEWRRWAGWARRRPPASAHARKVSRKPRGRATSSSVTMTQSKLGQVVAGQQRVEVLELAQAGGGGRDVDRHVVAGAQQLGARLGHQVGDVGRSMPTTSTRRRGAVRAASRRRRTRAGSAARSWSSVMRAQQTAALAGDVAAAAREEVVDAGDAPAAGAAARGARRAASAGGRANERSGSGRWRSGSAGRAARSRQARAAPRAGSAPCL